jgi:hypothetical protein
VRGRGDPVPCSDAARDATRQRPAESQQQHGTPADQGQSLLESRHREHDRRQQAEELVRNSLASDAVRVEEVRRVGTLQTTVRWMLRRSPKEGRFT